MRIKKKVSGKWVDILMEKIKRYPRYTLYQCVNVTYGRYIPLYKETFTREQLKEIVKNKYVVTDDNTKF